MPTTRAADPLTLFSTATRTWFDEAFAEPPPAQRLGWPPIAAGSHTLLHAPTGSGKTLAAFLWCLDRLHAPSPPRERDRRLRVLYVSPHQADAARLPLARVPGAYVVLVDGLAALHMERAGRGLLTLPALAEEGIAEAALAALPRLVAPGGPMKELRLGRVDRVPPGESALAEALRGIGFRPSYRSWLLQGG